MIASLPAAIALFTQCSVAHAATDSATPTTSSGNANAVSGNNLQNNAQGSGNLPVSKVASAPSIATTYPMGLKTIQYQGTGTSSPVRSQAYGLVAMDSGYETTYMPIYYLMSILQRIGGIQSSWNGQLWNLTVPSTFQVNLSNLTAPNTAANNTTIEINGQPVVALNSIVYTDPMSKQPTTYVPIWYLQEVLQRIGLNSTWNGTLWQLTQAVSGDPPATTQTSSSQTSQTSQTAQTPAPTFGTVDLRFPAPADINTDTINQYLQANNSPMTGLGSSFMTAQNTYGVDANYLVSHAILESYWGKSQIALAKNNLFGYGAYDSNPGNDAGLFPSNDYAIRFEAWTVHANYLDPGGAEFVAPTLRGMNVNYATDTTWHHSIAQLMSQLAAAQGDTVASYQQYLGPNSPAPAPQSTVEPVYYLNGGQGVVQSNSYYSGVPYFSSPWTGDAQQFFAPLQNGSFGDSVVTLQQFLNQKINAGLTLDGQFGPLTETAVKQYQQQQGLPVTGVWSYSMWQQIFPSQPTIPVGTPVQVDQIQEAMANGLVMEWYHVVGYGWVEAPSIQMSNMYRLQVPNPSTSQTSVPVYSPGSPGQVVATLHNGDFVVCNQPQPSNGGYTIQFANQLTGQMETGVVQATDATLTQQQ